MKEARDFLMPKLGLTMTEGTVSQWCVAEGDRFTKDDVLVVIETDKVAHEVLAPADGVLRKILTIEGVTAPVAQRLGEWDLEGYATSDRDVPDTDAAETDAAGVLSVVSEDRREDAAAPHDRGTFVRATPLARRLARENAIDLHGLAGSGPRGRIVADDVLAARTAPGAPTTGEAPDQDVAGRMSPDAHGKAMAAKLVQSKRTIPHFYLSTEVKADDLQRWRTELGAALGMRISMTHFFVGALARALRLQPRMNSIWQDEQIIAFEKIDVGVAVNTEKGLFNPVVKDLAEISFTELVRRVDEAIEKTRSFRLSADDMRGGAISLSNAGMFDVTYMTSIIPPSQAMILGVGAMREKFIPDELGNPKLSREIGIVLSVDHRLHTGVEALNFLSEIKMGLEQPLSLLAGF